MRKTTLRILPPGSVPPLTHEPPPSPDSPALAANKARWADLQAAAMAGSDVLTPELREARETQRAAEWCWQQAEDIAARDPSPINISRAVCAQQTYHVAEAVANAICECQRLAADAGIAAIARIRRRDAAPWQAKD